MNYTELQVTTNFTFLRGGSHPEELVGQAIELGYKAIAITDRNTLAGVVRAHAAAKGKDFRIIPACRLDLLDGPSLLAYPTHQAAYSHLSALLTEGNLRTEKGKCDLYKADVYRYAEGIRFIAVPPAALNESFDFDPSFEQNLREYRRALGKSLYLGAIRSYQGDDMKKLYRLDQLSQHLDIPLVATNDVHYHNFQRRELQDVLTCIREKCTIYNAGFRLHENAERYLKPAAEMQRLFMKFPEAIERTQEIADACQFSLSSLKYVYPEELTTEGRTPMEELIHLTWLGAKKRFPKGIRPDIHAKILHEFKFVEEMNYAAYFLTVYDIVRFANEQKILCQGRGSAANSVICYCLGITSVDPIEIDLLFERFISSSRNEPPDIDVDFEHERREEVMQYIYNKYGRDRAGIVATVTQVHQKGAVRDVAKAMGMSMDAISRLSSSLWEFTDEWFDGKLITEHGFNPNDPHLIKILDLTRQYMGFPRQLGQHTGGFVITQGKLSDLCPILNARMENRTCIEWNKDDIDTLGFLKIDVLALGMLTCIRKAFDLLKQHYDIEHNLASIPPDDQDVYDMICKADTIGVFQIESRAQQSMLPRLKPRCFYDLVIEVAIVRPGPIQGDMVHPYLRRRNDEEEVVYPKKELEDILKKTLGVPLFQEHAMKIAIVAAGFTATEADELRRSMATFKSKGIVNTLRDKLVNGMVKNGYEKDFAERIFKQLEGFGSYGFPESHAASFALLVYVSSWIKCHHPDVFAAALLNSQPMGFYRPAQIVIDARNHDVKVREIDINHSFWDNTLENIPGEQCALRLGFRQIKGLREEEMQILTNARTQPFTHIHQLLEAGISHTALEKLADADAFRSIGFDRRQAFWEASALADRPMGLFAGQPSPREADVELPQMTLAEHVIHDYATTSLSLKQHPVSFVREQLDALGAVPSKALELIPDSRIVKVAGLVLVRQRPGTASGICFITVEDETGTANLVVFQNLFDTYRKEILRSKLLMVEGKVQKEGSVIHVVVSKCMNASGLLRQLGPHEEQEPDVLTLSRADEKDEYDSLAKGRKLQARKNVQAEIFPASRDFR
ncbi:error-prone DNA polymerase [Dyadobacter fermentans]|uniref:Error-prone DNA polymerase n=1 Tax=Dyadobacter fermentans (strain ATCC 700827 / DSM 18053 / CIP 107007 / KCTC 52180 / NS114) TaxID=471854 RepID=C6VUA4_DYAFD|nr:error-prone DNA polymerase [Dyadobacter fermentans]ACT96586.1 DNA polymerase III, alpha subunit [Dyadobacter fermentans DSM 18053]